METAGTSLRYVGEEYDGIRFLTRVTMPSGVFNADEIGGFTLKLNGVDYEVVEIGSYLKRYEEVEGTEVELTKENAKWTAVAYKKGESDMLLLDYTSTYIDFASVMRTTYADRTYTARGYIVLKDAEGNETTVYAGAQQSDSINSALARM